MIKRSSFQPERSVSFQRKGKDKDEEGRGFVVRSWPVSEGSRRSLPFEVVDYSVGARAAVGRLGSIMLNGGEMKRLATSSIPLAPSGSIRQRWLARLDFERCQAIDRGSQITRLCGKYWWRFEAAPGAFQASGLEFSIQDFPSHNKHNVDRTDPQGIKECRKCNYGRQKLVLDGQPPCHHAYVQHRWPPRLFGRSARVIPY